MIPCRNRSLLATELGLHATLIRLSDLSRWTGERAGHREVRDNALMNWCTPLALFQIALQQGRSGRASRGSGDNLEVARGGSHLRSARP